MKNNIKKVIFALLPLMILLVTAEIGLRIIHFQLKGENNLALIATYEYTRHKILVKIASTKEGDIPSTAFNELFSQEGTALLEKFKQDYENNFQMLISETAKINTKLLVLYIPSDNATSAERTIICREFYSQLAQKYNIDFLDLTNEFQQYPIETVTLAPQNGHLSRFGNKLVAEQISLYLDKNIEYRSNHQFQNHPKLLGDLAPNGNRIWQINPKMPYRVITNRQGLRMSYDLLFPKEKQRVLILGDSFTFGPYLSNHDIYPNLLDAKYPNIEIINAGIAGYTITDEVSLFNDKAKYIEPDITILQVLDNDIYGLFYFKKNEFDRNNNVYEPSHLETEFLDKLRKNK